jgi:hypothetical protein
MDGKKQVLQTASYGVSPDPSKALPVSDGGQMSLKTERELVDSWGYAWLPSCMVQQPTQQLLASPAAKAEEGCCGG